MGIIFKTEKRRIIPKWRRFEVASAVGELNVSSSAAIPKEFDKVLLQEQRQKFLLNKDVTHAGDLLSSAYVLGLEKDFRDVAKYIVEKAHNENTLTQLANQVLKAEENLNSLLPDYEVKITNDISDSYQIQKYRYYLKNEPRNPIAWIELGRLYSLIGKSKKAQRCIETALYLDSNNRYIVRSASRFYNHYKADNEAALNVIRHSSFLKTDPWLLSADIAYSSILERHSNVAKIGIAVMSSGMVNNHETTELASALGTMEYSNGKIKSARKYFKESLISPNDNSLAQVRWMADNIQGLELDVSKYDIPLAFEANAISTLENGDFVKSLEFTKKWINDEPYSTRPVQLASYISSIFLRNNEDGISILKRGLSINPQDLMLNNNLVYFLVSSNQIDDALKVFNARLKSQINKIDAVSNLTITATAGLLLYRTGYREEGKKLYQQSIKLAKQVDNEYLIALAYVNYANEELRFIDRKIEISNVIKYLKNYCEIHKTPDILIFYDEVFSRYSRLSD